MSDFLSNRGQLTAPASFNATYADTRTPSWQTVPHYILPPDYEFGDPTLAQDFQPTRIFTCEEKYKLSIFGEMFNAFITLNPVNSNPANQTFTFGQPTTRALRTFGSSGPRAVQVGARFQF